MKTDKTQKLIFIYNANSGWRNQILDGAHKIISPSTYACNLCAVTFGAFTEYKTWKKFRFQMESDSVKMFFLHRDEFSKIYRSKFGYKFSYPIILSETENNLEVFVTTEELGTLEKAQDLIKIIEERLE